MENNILGCFVSVNMGEENGRLFGSYIFGENGIHDKIKLLEYNKYGNDLKIILFQFYVNPIPYLLNNIKDIEQYRKKEKAIGIPIVINDTNFFNKPETERIGHLKSSILEKFKPLEEAITKNNLDTNIKLLKIDLKKVLMTF